MVTKLMQDILIIAHFTLTPDEAGSDRFDYLARLLAAQGFCVELVTTAFSHPNKAARPAVSKLQPLLPYRLTLLDEPPYQKNVSIRRLHSHAVFGRNLRRYLAARKPPDALYCGVPTPDAADAAASYAKAHRIPFIIDIQDIWPDAFSMALPVPALGNLLFIPWRARIDRIYRAADQIVAVSETYARRAMRVNKKCAEPTVVYLGADLSAIDAYAKEHRITRTDGGVQLAYTGTLGLSYDIKTVIDALCLCRARGAQDLSFIVMGDGPQRAEYERYAKEKDAPVTFTGMLPFPEMIGRLCAADIAVNPIKAGSAGSIINKVCDYAAAGLPVINTQECPEYRQLVEQYRCGVNCRCGNADDVANAILRFCADKDFRLEAGVNARCMGEQLFNRERTYPQIEKLLLSTAH